MDWFFEVICLTCLVQVCLGQSGTLRGPALYEKNPKLSSSYIPAAMQIIAHSTELMKYVIKPPAGSTTTTTTTMRPTPPHRPAIFAPVSPPGPTFYYSKGNIHSEYVQRQQQPAGLNYFDRYYPLINSRNDKGRALRNGDSIYDNVESFVGQNFVDVLKLANRIDPLNIPKDQDLQLLEFSKDFEDSTSSYRYELLRQKRIPPTKAYVTLLTLYDSLNKESKRLMLNKYTGYTEEVLNNLVEFSSSTSSYQLRSVFNKIIENGDTDKPDIVKKIKSLISDLDEEKSYINEAVKDIPPLIFAH